MGNRFRSLPLFLVLSLPAWGCADRTSIQVEVTSRHYEVPEDVDGLAFTIEGLDSGALEQRAFTIDSAWPHTLTVEPGEADRETVMITLEARKGGTLVERMSQAATFEPGSIRTVTFVLGSNPGGADGGVPKGGDGGCRSATECDDGIDCTLDSCRSGTCLNEPDDALCEDGSSCSVTTGCPAKACGEDADCLDARSCNGEERCVEGTCRAGASVDCNDDDACTDDLCEESEGGCVHTTADIDGDGYGSAACEPVGGVPADDCNDRNTSISPEGDELCNGADDDCNGTCDDGPDMECCVATTQPCTTSCGSTGVQQCSNACRWQVCEPPEEACNGDDDDCDGEVDEGCGACGACDSATVVSAPGGRFTLSLGPHERSGSCGGAGSEAYLSFTLTETSDVFVTTHHTGDLDTALYVRECDCDGAEVACNDDADGLSTSLLRLTELEAGTYNVVVDTEAEMSAEVAVDLYISAPGRESDRCGNPAFLPAGTSVVQGNTCSYADDLDVVNGSECSNDAGGNGPDRVYYFYLSAPSSVGFDGCNDATQYDTTIYTRTVCTDPSFEAQTACDDDDCGGPPSCDGYWRSDIEPVSLDRGLHFFVVDGWDDGTPTCPCGDYGFQVSGL